MSKKIYFLSSPEDFVPRYVGCTSSHIEVRLYSHLSDAIDDNSPRSVWIRGLVERGIRPSITYIRLVQEWENWEDVEKQYISMFREKYPLLNRTIGGTGCIGMEHSEETRQKLSETHMGKKKSKRPKRSLVIMGANNPKSKKVRCVETGEVFVCLRYACAHIKKHRKAISKAIKYGEPCGGYMWEYVNE